MSKKPSSKRVQPVTLADVLEVKKRLEAMSEQATALAEVMDGFDGEVMVDGGKRAWEGITFLTRWLHSTRSAFDLRDIPRFDDEESSDKPRPDHTPLMRKKAKR